MVLVFSSQDRHGWDETHIPFNPAAWCFSWSIFLPWIGASPSSVPAAKHQGGNEQGGIQQLHGYLPGPKNCCSSHLPTLLEHIWSPWWSALLLPHCMMNCMYTKCTCPTAIMSMEQAKQLPQIENTAQQYLPGWKKGDFLQAANQNSARERRCTALTFVSLHGLIILPGPPGSTS